MPSKTSKPRRTPQAPSKAARACFDLRNEAELSALAAKLGSVLKPGDRLFLEGPLGAGKTTFASHLLRALGVRESPGGSPTFPIAQEYATRVGEVIHLDLYRLKSQRDLEDAGIEAYFWEREALVLCEWGSLWPELLAAVLKTPGGRVGTLSLAFVDAEPGARQAILEGPRALLKGLG